MERTERDALASQFIDQKRSRGSMCGALVLAAVLLSACGALSPTTQIGNVGQASAVPSPATARPTDVIPTSVVVDEAPASRAEMTATAGMVNETPTVEAASTTGANVSEGSTAVVDAGVAPVTAVMKELGLAGEQFAAVGDTNAPLTVIEFSDYG
jgi:hypothetical protein